MFESVRGLSLGLSRAGRWAVQVRASSDEFTAVDRPVWGDLDIATTTTGPIQELLGLGGLARLLRSGKPDIAHVHGIWGPAAQAVVAWSRTPGRTPYLVSPRGMMDHWALDRSRWKKKIALILWCERLIGQASCVHALNQSEASSVRAFGFKGPICVIPNAVETPSSASHLAPVGGRKDLLFLGRLHPKKGLEELLVGWSRLDPRFRRQWRLIIAGWDDGGHESSLKLLRTQLGLEESVEFAGPLYGAVKAEALRRASAFILPSRSEGLPMAVLEAWSIGLPVFMTPACNLPDGFETGAAFPIETDPDNIAAALTSKLDDELGLSAAGAAGRTLAAAYNWDAVVRQMADVYDWLLDRRGTPPACVDPGNGRD